MLMNYLKAAFRSLARNKQFTVLNILGLAMGLAACLLMAGYVIHELSFERIHVHRDRIFRVNVLDNIGGGSIYNAAVVSPLGPAAEGAIPEIDQAVRFAGKYDLTLTTEAGSFSEKRLYFTEPQAFEVFTFPLLRGDPRTALEAPFSLVIDETLAAKYFGSADPVGRTVKVKFDKTYEFQVTGVMRPLPTNTVLRVRLLASFATLEKLTGDQLCQNLNAWRSFGLYYTFLRLRPGANPKTVEAKIAALVKTPLGDEAKAMTYSLQPLKDIYLETNKSQISNDFNYSGSPGRVLLFASIALLILLLACINFVNLSIAKVSQRLRGVGVRKTCGAGRSSLMTQFLAESVLLASAAMGIGVFLFRIFKLPLDAYLGENLSMELGGNPALLAVLGGLVLVVGFLAGSFPGLFLARIPVNSLLRSGGPALSIKSTLRRTLVVFQFVIAIGLTAWTFGIIKQIRFAEGRDLGYDKRNLVVLEAREAEDAPRMKALQAELLTKAEIVEACLISAVPAGQNRWMTSMKPADGQDEKQRMIQLIAGDARFVPAFGIQVVQGRNFEEGRGTDRTAILLNETAVRALGLKNPVGSRLIQGNSTIEVIGVVRDFNTNSIHSRIYPVALLPASSGLSTLCVRVPPGEGREAVGRIRSVWNRVFPDRAFSFEYVEDIVDRAYDNEKRLAVLMAFFCGLAVLVAALGIFGLSAFISEQRTKEIGVRKVLGATVPGIVALIAKGFARWVLAANVLAWPLAYYGLAGWLRGFAFRTSIGLLPFIMSGFLILVVALSTVSYQAVKAALADPVVSLKYE